MLITYTWPQRAHREEPGVDGWTSCLFYIFLKTFDYKGFLTLIKLKPKHYQWSVAVSQGTEKHCEMNLLFLFQHTALLLWLLAVKTEKWFTIRSDDKAVDCCWCVPGYGVNWHLPFGEHFMKKHLLQLPSCYTNDVIIYSHNCFLSSFCFRAHFYVKPRQKTIKCFFCSKIATCFNIWLFPKQSQNVSV